MFVLRLNCFCFHFNMVMKTDNLSEFQDVYDVKCFPFLRRSKKRFKLENDFCFHTINQKSEIEDSILL
jgi:hypothetical protein